MKTMSFKNPVIVIVGYNRPRSLKRLINSLEKAVYPTNDISLIISIDKSPDNASVKQIADDFNWKFGVKKVVYQKENLGLKKHIVQCMQYTFEYENIILLEDDLFVAPDFYNYTVQALKFTAGNEKIGGISLYNHQFNVHKGVNFSPLEDGFDNWYFQFASSWGQAWSAQHITKFLEWFNNSPTLENNKELPKNVFNWSDKSWLKFYISYLIEKDRYFLYPKISLSTNFSDPGTHIQNDNTTYQVPLSLNRDKEYNFSTLNNSKSVYDAFYESQTLFNLIGFEKNEVAIDLYGYKINFDKRYLLSSQILDYKVLKSFGKSLKPIDGNVVFEIEGNDIFLYDRNIEEQNTFNKNTYNEIIYQVKHLDHRSTAVLFYEATMKRIKHNLKKIIK